MVVEPIAASSAVVGAYGYFRCVGMVAGWTVARHRRAGPANSDLGRGAGHLDPPSARPSGSDQFGRFLARWPGSLFRRQRPYYSSLDVLGIRSTGGQHAATSGDYR